MTSVCLPLPGRAARLHATERLTVLLDAPARLVALLLTVLALLLPGVASAQTTLLQPPLISGFTPATGPAGTQITVVGENLGEVTQALTGGVVATVVSTADQRLVLEVPDGAKSSRIKLATPRYSRTSATSFAVIPPAQVSRFTPLGGNTGTVVTVFGKNFSTATAARVGSGAPQPVTLLSGGKLRFTVPAGSQSGPVVVTTEAGDAASTTAFSIVEPPVLTAFSPASGPAGTEVTIQGEAFDDVTRALIGNVAAEIVSKTPTTAVIVIPEGAKSSKLKLVNAGYTGVSATSFEVITAPLITGFTPEAGDVGTLVTVTGKQFATVSSARLGSGSPFPVSVVGDGKLRFTVPEGSRTGAITLVNVAGSGSSAAAFTVNTPVPPPPPPPPPLPPPPPEPTAEISEHLVVDQFGYRPDAVKTAVIRSAHAGYDGSRRYTPGARYALIREDDGVTVLSGSPVAWNGGAVDASAGDAAWWFDFSAVRAPGHYHVLDIDRNLRSPSFRIADDVYAPVLRAALRTFFYQRAGFAKREPYAEQCWTDEAAFVGPNQDTAARDVTDPGNAAKVRDLSGGWFDAGDSNKYVTFAAPAVHQLLAAYQSHPAAFGDDLDIPESGNGVPDVLDEVKWEIDWLKKMQDADGSTLLKVGITSYNEVTPPSASREPRYYVPACTSSTIAAAGMFAHAALVWQDQPGLAAGAADLRDRAVRAYDRFAAAGSRQTNCDDGTVKYGDADRSAEEQAQMQTVAAVYLYALTGEARFHDRIRSQYRALRPYRDMGWSRYQPEQGTALLFYSRLPTADAALAATIRADKRNDANPDWNEVYGLSASNDPYRAYLHPDQYHWGSHQVRANYGNSNLDVLSFGIAVDDPTPFETRAEDTLHYFHGVNPFGLVYFSNVNALGATRSLSTIYHQAWFQDGHPLWDDLRTSSCGPAPGYLPGGPNAGAQDSGVPAWLTPPTQQPRQKAYLEWNSPSEAAYAITEPAIYYQSAYIKLLAGFVRR